MMTSKTSQQGAKRGSQRAPQASPLTTALSKFISKLENSTLEQGDIIGVRDIINTVVQCLRTCRKNSTLVEQTFIEALVRILDADHGYEICSRLDASLYSILIQIFMQSEYCKESERGFSLLAAGLYYDSCSDKPGIYKKKEVIGKECLSLMLDFFIDQEKQHGMRRWVGLAYIQLVQSCERNIERLGMGSEEARRSLGTRLFDDPDEIVKLICGQLIRALVDNGMNRDHLWPIGTAKENYQDFPGSTQDNKSWRMRLSNFLDNVYENVPNLPESAGQVYFAQDVNLKPQLNFGVKGHNMTFALDPEHVTMWAGATTDTVRFDQSVEVPLVFLARLTIRSRDGSQDLSALANVHLELGAQNGIFCYLDCVRTVIQQVTMVMRIADVSDLAKDLRELCPQLLVDNEFSQNRNDLRPASIPSQSQSQEPLIFGNVETPLQVQSSPNVAIGAAKVQPIELTPPTIDAHSESTKSPASNNDLDVVPKVLKIVIDAKTTTGNTRVGVKPKAKTPLVMSQKVSSIGCGKTLDNIHVTDRRKGQQPATESIISHQIPPSTSQEDLIRLREVFPTVDDPQLRASLLASNGKLELAAEMIAKRSRVAVGTSKETAVASGSENPKARIPGTKGIVGSSSNPNVHDDGFNWEPQGSPEAGDISTPRPKRKGKGMIQEKKDLMKLTVPKDGMKRPSKYSLKKSVPSAHKASIIPKGKGKTKAAVAKFDEEEFSEAAPPNSLPTKKPAKESRLNKRNSAPELMQQSKDETADQVDEFEFDFDQPQPSSRELPQKNNPEVAGLVAAQKSLIWGHKLGNILGDSVTPDVRKRQKTSLAGLTQTNLTRPPITKKEVALITVTGTTSAGVDLIEYEDNSKDSKNIKNTHKGLGRVAATVIDSIRKSKNSSVPAKKRKVNPSEETPSRKRTSNRVSNGNTAQSSIGKIPHIQEELGAPQAIEGSVTPRTKNTRQKRAVRKKPELAVDTPVQMSEGKVLVDDYLARKQTVIGFGVTGPKNQGPTSVVKMSDRSTRSTKLSEALAVPVEKAVEQKRKRPTALDVEEPAILGEERPKKRQSLSPVESFGGDASHNYPASDSPPSIGFNADETSPEGPFDQATTSASLAALPIRNAVPSVSNPIKVKGHMRASKSNSQTSRVDANGSPMASSGGPQIDHVRKAEQKLREDPPDGVASFRGVGDAGIFGRKIVLGSIPKAGPSSPLRVLARYVPHKKTRSGMYEDVATKELVELERRLPDPFVDNKVRTSSGFTHRLLAGASKVDEVVPPSSKRSALKANGNSRIQQGSARFAADVEKTLVNSENEDPSEMTSGSTFNSSEDGLAEASQDPNEAWKSALRPHYSKLSDVVHRVADEVVIRLAREEDALGLLADQYESNGNRMLANVSIARNSQKARIQKELGAKKHELVEIYNDAKTYVDKVQKNVEKSGTTGFEQGWKKQQASIQKHIDEACQAMEEWEY